MPHTNRNKKNKKKSHKIVAKAPQDVALRDTLEYAMTIPDFRPQSTQRYTFRWVTLEGNGATLSSVAWTTPMMLDIYCVAVGGGSVQPCRLFNAMRLRSVKMWTAGLPAASTGNDFGLEFSPSLIAGYGGAPRIPILGTCLSPEFRQPYIYGVPKKNELASQWFTAQQGAYTLFNLSFPPGSSCLELDFDVVFVNGETPAVTSFVTSAAKGTIGTGNFSGYSVTGFRSVGLVNLATP